MVASAIIQHPTLFMSILDIFTAGVNYSGGYSEYTGRSSAQDHSAREPQKMRPCGETGGGVSSEPAGISTASSSGTTRGIGPPHF